MKKKWFIYCFILLIVIGMIIGIILKNKANYKRYEEIKKNVKEEAIIYLTITRTIDSKEEYLSENDIVNPFHRGADKDIILDVDKKTYCKVSIKSFVKNNKWDADVYLKCKNYEDDLYEDTLLMYMCMYGVPKGYEDYYKKYGKVYDNLNCPQNIMERIRILREAK